MMIWRGTPTWCCIAKRIGAEKRGHSALATKPEKGTETMIPRVGQMLLFSTSLMMLGAGCQKQADDGANQKPLSQTEAAKYRQVTVKVTGLT